jgi:hypothetical protein
MLAVDLDRYDLAPETRPLIRATEGTVPERLPPRVEIRRNAPLETPHILLLIDDREDALIPALGRRAKGAAPLYQTPLMLGGGEIAGWALDTEADWALLVEGLESLARQSLTRYDITQPFLYAVGDGNHSLATAKAVWDEYKAAHPDDPALANHPARWALVEVENLYDPGISFEPIHRVLFGTTLKDVLEALSALRKKAPGPAEGGLSGPIIVVEKNPSLFTLALETRDLRELFAPGDLILVVGGGSGGVTGALALLEKSGTAQGKPQIDNKEYYCTSNCKMQQCQFVVLFL